MSTCLTEEEVLAHLAGQGDGHAVLAHIETCARCRTLVACAAESEDSSGSRSSRDSPRDTAIRIGAVLAGRYEISRFLGKGGMGEVYEARDMELGHSLALKTLAMTTLDDEKAVSRLKGEVLLARRVAHPNVCRIFDFAVHESRRASGTMERIPFLTMELLAGETLGQRLLREGPMATERAQTIVLQIVAGLSEVHRAGIVHRDLKCENVFLAGSGPDERAVLMDFGLARSALSADPGSASFMLSLVGTAAYMSPEQIEQKPIGPQSDIYALGVVMYQMVTGKLPFTGSTVFEVALERLHRLPPPPSKVNPLIPPPWERTIMKCLAIRSGERFGLATDIPPALSRVERIHRGRWRLAVGAGVAAALVAAGVVGWRAWLREAPKPVPPKVERVEVAPAGPASLVPPAVDPRAPVPNEKNAVPTEARQDRAPAAPESARKNQRRDLKKPARAPLASEATAPAPMPTTAMQAKGEGPGPAAPTSDPHGQDQTTDRQAGDPVNRIYNPFAPRRKVP